jgi:hypothetical protein
MKRTNIGWRVPRQVSSRLALTLTLVATGCTHVASKRAKTHSQLDEHSRALTTAVVDSLQLQPREQRDNYTEFALRVAREDQRIEGLPIDPIPVEPFVQADETHSLATLKAGRALSTRFTEIEKLIAAEKKQTDRLIAFGETHEEIQNRTRARWAKWIGSGSLLIGGLVALCVFVPAAIPVLGRILGWIVSRIPALAGAFGVVGVKAFDAVVKGIERTKGEPSEVSRINNQTSVDSWSEKLHLNLSREMDSAHKALVHSRKAALNARGGAR